MARRRKASGVEAVGFLVLVALGALVAAIEWIGQHPEVLVLVVVAAGGLLVLGITRSNRRAQAEQRAMTDYQATNHRRILNDCLALCRDSAKAATRTSRATVGIEQVGALRRLGALEDAEASRLEQYFRAVAQTAASVEAFTRGAAASTERTRTKRFAEARALASDAGFTDEVLRSAEATHPSTGAPLSLADLVGGGTNVDDRSDDVPVPASPAVDLRRSAASITLSVGNAQRKAGPPQSNARWIPPGETVVIGGRSIPGGMLWVGRGLAAVASPGPEPALIDPALSVDETDPDLAGDLMSYWPTYVGIDPRSKAAHLSWLAGGRTASDIGLGYVFLFFYGLERRLLDDAQPGRPGADEIGAIRAEIVRLVGLHDRGSFPSYAQGLIDYIDARWPNAGGRAPTYGRPSRGGIPLGIRAALGRAALAGQPVTPELALAWVRAHPSPELGRSLTACAHEFDALFVRRYAERFGSGLVLKANRARIVHRYQPASESFAGQEFRTQLDLPDPTQLSGPWNQLQPIADGCCQDLEPLRRLVTRRPDARSGPEAFAVLPAELGDGVPASLEPLRTWAESTLSRGDTTTESETLLRLWREAGGDTTRPRPTSVAMAQVLARWDVGIEPDTRFGGPPIGADGTLALFPNPRPAADAPSDGYAAAVVASQLCAVAAMADGHVHPDEVRALDRHLAVAPDLDDGERRRLLAHFHWTLRKPPSMATLSRRLRDLPLDARDVVASLVLKLVATDGQVDTPDLKLLARVYKALELDPGRIHADVHRVITSDTTASDDPPVVRPDIPRVGFAIPEPAVVGTVVLDHARVQQRVAESARVAHMLGAIFVDDAESAPPPPPIEAGAAGLDSAHSTLLRKLAGSASIPRATFEGLAAAANLFPDGAIETLNEAAFAAADAPLCEGDDPIELDQQVLEVMLR